MSELPEGVVFDCDGTLADTESLSDRAWTEALVACGITPTADDFRALVGYPFSDNWEYFSRRGDLGDRETFRRGMRTRFLELFATELEVHPDAIRTVRELAARAVPIAVASSSYRASVERVLDRAGIRALVHVIVAFDDVQEPKPAAEPYTRAANGLGLDPAVCTAVEDSPVGVRSARAAGLFTVGVVRSHADAVALAEADRVVEEITVAALVPDGRDDAAARRSVG